MKRSIRVTQKLSKALLRRKNVSPKRRTLYKSRKLKKKIIEDTNIKENPPLSGIKEVYTIVKETIEENIVINQGMSLEGLHHKKNYSLPGMKVSFMVIFLLVLNLDIKK
jgi:hypothetical protein